MLTMKFTYKTLTLLQEDMEGKILSNRLSNITVMNSRDFIISFSMYRKEKLLISLSHQSPFMTFVETNQPFQTMMGQTNEVLRKELKDAAILQIDILNNDRILQITLQKSNDYYEKVIKKLVIELIPMKPNLLILDEEGKIIYALHYVSLDKPHPLLKGMTYELMEKVEGFVPNQDSEPLEQVKRYGEAYLIEANKEHFKERYDFLFKFLKSRIKSLKNKVKVLEQEMEKAQEDFIYAEYGNTLLSFADEPEAINEYISSHHLELDSKLSIGQNANKFFKRYKKSKRTIEMDHLELEKAKDEIDRLTIISAQSIYMNDEELLSLAKELMPHKFKNSHKGSKAPSPSPLSYVIVDGSKIFFGKNAKQNDELTFKKAQKEDWFFHLKDYHGSHVLIANARPTDEMKLTAAEMCLLLSDKQEGEVQYTTIKNIKKGSQPGQALLTTYEIIILKQVRKETRDLLNHYLSR